MNDREKMIEKIKKLLAVTEERGATEGEAIQAALMAQKLMADNDINDYELATEEESIETAYAKKSRTWQTLLARVIAENFRCKCYTEYKKANGAKRSTAYAAFFGYKHDAQAAKLVYEKLVEIGHKQAFKYAKEREADLLREGHMNVKRNRIYNDFVLAFIEGVKSELEKQSQALMIVCPAQVNNAYTELSRDFAHRTTILNCHDDNKAQNAGKQAGRDAVMSGRINASDNSFCLSA